MTYVIKQSNLPQLKDRLHLDRKYSTSENCILLSLPGNGRQVLFSYGLAVAAFVPGRGYLRVNAKYSAMTERHIRTWINGESAAVSQEELDGILYNIVPE